jgi:SpoVK/Ycf46/Vps4 family AAA+-type ATPase
MLGIFHDGTSMAMKKVRNNNEIESVHSFDIEESFVHLARLALLQRTEDVAALARQSLRHIAAHREDLRAKVDAALKLSQPSPVRRQIPRPLPVDSESRLELLRSEPNVHLDHEPQWAPAVAAALRRIVKERSQETALRSAGVSPTRSLLFVGPPGVGKTLAAQWIARETNRPLLVLDLAGVMNSFLGKTGSNLRVVMEHAKREPSVLLLDEFDALAKRRDDAADVGELKRLVTVLIQELDSWPDTGLLICATNHPELLDPAIWRRFDSVLHFPLPSRDATKSMIGSRLSMSTGPSSVAALVSTILSEASYADVDRLIFRALRNSIIDEKDIESALLELATEQVALAPVEHRISLGAKLIEAGYSQRRASDLTGVARDTLRKRAQQAKTNKPKANRPKSNKTKTNKTKTKRNSTRSKIREA